MHGDGFHLNSTPTTLGTFSRAFLCSGQEAQTHINTHTQVLY